MAQFYLKRPNGKTRKILCKYPQVSYDQFIKNISYQAQKHFKVIINRQIYFLLGNLMNQQQLLRIQNRKQQLRLNSPGVIYVLDRYKFLKNKLSLKLIDIQQQNVLSLQIDSDSIISQALSSKSFYFDDCQDLFLYAGRCLNLKNTFRQQLVQDCSSISVVKISSVMIKNLSNQINYLFAKGAHNQDQEQISKISYQKSDLQLASLVTGRFKSITQSQVTQTVITINTNEVQKQIKLQTDIRQSKKGSQNRYNSQVDIQSIGEPTEWQYDPQSLCVFQHLIASERQRQKPKTELAIMKSTSKSGQQYCVNIKPNKIQNNKLTQIAIKQIQLQGLSKTQGGQKTLFRENRITGKQVKHIFEQTKRKFKKQVQIMRKQKICLINNHQEHKKLILSCQSESVYFQDQEQCVIEVSEQLVYQNQALYGQFRYDYDPFSF